MTPPVRRNVSLATPAEIDLAEIVAWTLAEYGRRQARIYAGLINESIAVLHNPDEPLLSRLVSELLPEVRRWSVPRTRHVLFYRADAGGVRVLRILHVAMDPLRHIDLDDYTTD